MRTTLVIDDNVLAKARAVAKREQRSLGEVISHLARTSLERSPQMGAARNGIPLLAVEPGSKPATLEIVNRLRDDVVDVRPRR